MDKIGDYYIKLDEDMEKLVKTIKDSCGEGYLKKLREAIDKEIIHGKVQNRDIQR
jgi:hypothetical protein